MAYFKRSFNFNQFRLKILIWKLRRCVQEGLEWPKTIFRKRHTDSIGFNSISYPKIIPGSQMHKNTSYRFKRVYLYLQTNIAGKEVIVKNPRVLDKKQIQGGMEKPLHSMLRCLWFCLGPGSTIREIKSMHICSMSQRNGPLINMDCMVKINFTW